MIEKWIYNLKMTSHLFQKTASECQITYQLMADIFFYFTNCHQKLKEINSNQIVRLVNIQQNEGIRICCPPNDALMEVLNIIYSQESIYMKISSTPFTAMLYRK